MRISWKSTLSACAGILLFGYLLAVWWSFEPDVVDIKQQAQQAATETQLVPGYTTATALITVLDTLLNKSGGYLSNDVTPPSLLMDNMPGWEFGVLEQSRDFALVMRRDFARSQSQSSENPELALAQPKLNIDNTAWMFPSAEGEYQLAVDALKSYRAKLVDPNDYSAQFFARADNLREWLKLVEKRLGGLSQKLSSSVGKEMLNIDLAGESSAVQATQRGGEQRLKTSWWQIDDVFYQARGEAWALLHFLSAVETDFEDVLLKKNALVSLRQIIRELETTQQTVWSPLILNGSGFGLVANHSLVMANYISRANAAVIDLNELLAQG